MKVKDKKLQSRITFLVKKIEETKNKLIALKVENLDHSEFKDIKLNNDYKIIGVKICKDDKDIILIEKEKTVHLEDMNLIKIVDTEDEVVKALDDFYKKYNLSPNI